MPTDGLIHRLSTALTGVRGYSERNLRYWLENHETRQGGILIVRASWRGRDLIEADFRSELYPL
jgi:hypothetical protein